MKRLTVTISDELDKQLRAYVAVEYSGIRGGLSVAVKRAIEEFLEKRGATPHNFL